MTKNTLLIIIVTLFCTLTLNSALAQDAKLSSEIQNAIKIRKNNELKNSRGNNQTNFLIGMCLSVSGKSGCNVSQATKNINSRVTSSETWISFLESKSIFENYISGMNGQISDAEGLSINNLKYRIIDKDNLERDTISGNNCIHTLHFKKISSTSVILKTTRVSDSCSEQFKTMMRSDMGRWSEPKNIFPLENRFTAELRNQISTDSKKPVQTQSVRLINDLFKYRWVDQSSKCNLTNTNYFLHDQQHGRYLVWGGSKLIDAKELPVVVINEISTDQVSIFKGIGKQAKSHDLFDYIERTHITRRSDGSILVRLEVLDLFDNNGRLLKRDSPVMRSPENSINFPCLDINSSVSSTQSQPPNSTSIQSSDERMKTDLALKELFKNSSIKPDFKNIESTEPVLIKNGWMKTKCIDKDEIGISCFTKNNHVIEIEWAPAGQMGGTIGETKIYPSQSQSQPPQPQPQRQQPSNTTQTLNYSHGRYVGEVMNGKAHGYGTYTSAKSGTVYTGQFIADTFSGDGTMTWTNGSKFVGKWQNDVGVSGTMTYANGSTTSGTVRTGVFTPSSVQSPKSQSQPSQPQANIDVEIKYADGAIYVGQIKNGKSDGKGTLTQISGDRYVGEFKDGLKDGQGTMSVANGNRYVGQYKNDMRSGQGTFTWKNGDHYVGEYKNNMRNGRGTFTWNDGSRYVGEYKDGNENGQGTLTWANGNRYAGEWKGGLRDGQGALTGANGNRYVGEWKDGEENGEGIFTWPNGARYVGEFKDGKRTGQGTFTWANRDRYVGQFKDNEMNGQGTLTLADGGSYVGEFKNGKEDGQGTFIWKDGTSYVGQFKNGEMNGIGTEITTNGNIYVGEFKDDDRSGQGILTWANGDRYVGEFKNDKRNGKGTFTSKDGTKQVGLFKDDIFVESQTNTQSTSIPSQPKVDTDIEKYKIRIMSIRREIESLQRAALVLNINNMPNDPTKNLDPDKINDLRKLSEVLSEINSTRDSLKGLLDKAYSLAPSLKTQ